MRTDNLCLEIWLYLYIAVVIFYIHCCITKPLSSSFILDNNTSNIIACKDHTNIRTHLSNFNPKINTGTQPTRQPTSQPSMRPSGQPTGQPSGQPTRQPTSQPSGQPTSQPSGQPSSQPTGQPSSQPSSQPTGQPTGQPTRQPSGQPTSQPTGQPTGQPSRQPSGQPTSQPTSQPSMQVSLEEGVIEEGHHSILLVFCFMWMWSGAFDRSNALLSYHVISLASYITIILLIPTLF